MSIYVTKPTVASLQDYMEEIQPILESRILTNRGPVQQELQHQLTEYLQVPELSLFSNGHLALEAGLRAFDFPAGSEVITTPYTFVSTTHAIVRVGLVPVFCDIEPDTYTMDAAQIEPLITERTVAILPVHVYGNLCDVNAIQEIADWHGLKVLYDGAHAFGTSLNGTTVGNFGDLCMYSFHATKVFNTIEGGAIAFHDPSYSRKLQEQITFGIAGEGEICTFGGNAKMDEIHAAFGLCNLRHIDENIQKRKAVAEKYDALLGKTPGIRLLTRREGAKSNYAYYPVYFDKEVFGKSRDEVCDMLQQNEIYARRYFYPATNDLACYRDKYAVQETPVAHDTAQNILCLPIYPELELADVERICDVILQ